MSQLARLKLECRAWKRAILPSILLSLVGA